MKILLVSDIHGNWPALEAVSTHKLARQCEHVFNCGDSLVYAPFSNETLQWLQEQKAFSIRGNTDDKVIKLLKGKNVKKPSKPEKRVMYLNSKEELEKENREYLLELKKKKIVRIKGYTIGLFHGSPEDHTEFLFSSTPDQRFAELAGVTSCDIVVTGHSHTPYHKRVNGVHFINPGSVGRMFDGNPEASFAVLEIKKESIRVVHYRCPYPVEKVVQRLREYKLPAIYQTMYRRGEKLN